MASTGNTDAGLQPQGLRLAHSTQLTDLARTGRPNADGRLKQAYQYPRAIVLLNSMVVGGRSSTVPFGRSVGPTRARWFGKRAHKPCRYIWYPIRSDVSLSLGWMGAVQAPTQYGSRLVVAQSYRGDGRLCKVRHAAKVIAQLATVPRATIVSMA